MDVLLIILIAIMVVCAVYILLTPIAIAKINNAVENHHIIIDAIYEYVIWAIDNGADIKVFYDDMEFFDQTCNRFWDWGYTRILPPDKFALVKPFIGKEN